MQLETVEPSPPAPPAPEEPGNRNPRASRLQHWGRIGLAIIILVILFRNGHLDPSAFSRVRLGFPLMLLAGVVGLSLVATSLRWVLVVRAALRIGDATSLFRVSLASNVLAIISPAGSGADVARVYHLLRNRQVGTGRALGIGLLDRLMGLQTLLTTTALFGWWDTDAPALLRGTTPLVALAALLLLLVCLVMVSPKPELLLRLIPKRWRALESAGETRWKAEWLVLAYATSLLASVSNQALPMLGVFVFTGAWQGGDALHESAVVVLANSLALTPGGVGIGEAAASQLFQDSALGAPAMLLVRAVTLGWCLVMSLGAVLGGTGPAQSETASELRPSAAAGALTPTDE